MPKDCLTSTVDPDRLLAWGNSQLQKIEKEIKQKKSNPEVENYSKLTNKKRHVVEYSYTESKEAKVFQEYSEEKQISNTRRLKGNSKSFDRLEMKESEDVVNASKKKKRKKDKCELVSVNIELKKGDVSYETNFSNSNKKKSKKRNYEGSNDEVRKMEKKKKGCLSESDENLKKCYVMCIKLTESAGSNTATRDNVNKHLKLKNKKKTNDSERQGGNLEIEQNELSPPKKKKKCKKDIYEKFSKEESDLETVDPNESISKKKTKKKKMRDSCCTEHEGKKILSDVNEIENEVNVNNISVHTKKEKSKKRTVPSEDGEADSPTVHKKKKKKNKEMTDNAELNTCSEVIYISDTDLNTSSYSQNHKKKKKKEKEIVEETSSEIYVKKKKKKKKKREKNMESLDDDDNSVFSISCVSTCSSKPGKLGMNFGKSAISRLLTNQESCSTCCEMNTNCSRKICNNNSNISTSAETNTKDDNQEEPNKKINNSQVETIQNCLVTIKQEKIDTEVQNHLPANITIKQEKIDEPSLSNPIDICGKMTALNQNVQVKQEVCDMSMGHSSNHGEKNENISEANVVNHENCTHQTPNVGHDEPSLNNPTDICEEMTALNQNVQVKPEICDMSMGHSSNHGEKNENISVANVVNHENATYETANVGHDNVNDIPVLTGISSHSGNTESGDNINSTNVCLSENQNRQTCGESNEQYYMNSYESYYNFSDNKFTVHEEIGVYNEAQNCNNSSSEIKIDKRLAIMNNEEFMQKEFPHDADVSHPNRPADSVINSEQVSNEEICHNYGVTNIEDNDTGICYNITANNKDIIKKSLGLNYKPLSNVEQRNQADRPTSMNIRNVSHPNQNIDAANCVINSQQVSNEEICHNYGVTKIENNDICHNITDNNKNVTEKSLGLNYIPLYNMEQHSQADTSIKIRTVHQENSELRVTVNQFHSQHQYYQSPTGNEFQSEQHYHNTSKNEYHYQQTKLIHKKNNKESHKSRCFNKRQSNPVNKSVLFTCIRPQFRVKEQVARLLHVDISQVEFCYYRMNSKFYQDVHVKFSDEKQFQNVVRYYANRVHCRTWHIKEDKGSNVKDAYKKKNSRPSE